MEDLKKELLLYKQDGMFALYFSLNRKINELSASLNSFTLDITADDKGFDRFQKLTASLKDMVESTNWLRVNYLKMDEQEAKEAEKKGIPLIEHLIKLNKNEK
jgi:ribosomal protein S2